MGKIIFFMIVLIFLSSMAFTVENAPNDDTICEQCKKCHPAAANQLQKGKMKFLSCIACHGKEHMGPGTGPVFSPDKAAIKSCIPCHKNEYTKYTSSKHYEAWPALTAVVAYKDAYYPTAATDVGCVHCHQIGQGWPDGTRGRCNYCHTQHTFSIEEAREPETCRMCHAGDQPQYEAWSNSMHGSIYEIEGSTGRAPTCITCHDAHNVITAWGFLGLRGEGGNEDAEWKNAQQTIMGAMDVLGLSNSPKAIHTFEEWKKLREEMIGRCSNCHVESFVRSEMEKSDKFLRELDLAEADIIKTVTGLYERKLIDSKVRMSLYYGSIIVRIGAFIGAFHNAPSLAWDHGYFKLYPESFLAQQISKLHNQIDQTIKIAIIIFVVIVIIVGLIYIFSRRKKSKKSAT